jgi:hypothetical protein
VHHAVNLQYIDKNYGGMLIIFDRLVVTYAAERDDVKIRYGLVEPELSNNPIKIEFVEWRKLFKDLMTARSLRAVFGALFMPPGWSADGKHHTTEALPEKERSAQKSGSSQNTLASQAS